MDTIINSDCNKIGWKIKNFKEQSAIRKYTVLRFMLSRYHTSPITKQWCNDINEVGADGPGGLDI